MELGEFLEIQEKEDHCEISFVAITDLFEDYHMGLSYPYIKAIVKNHQIVEIDLYDMEEAMGIVIGESIREQILSFMANNNLSSNTG
ncbi:hypothetical protein ABHN11_24765 [Brevibacillus centrosporus]|uniref:hypothetical protein n=1 Tax=Brevibacillus centrosporus TaxID=54910 RepID=UPI003D1951C5